MRNVNFLFQSVHSEVSSCDTSDSSSHHETSAGPYPSSCSSSRRCTGCGDRSRQAHRPTPSRDYCGRHLDHYSRVHCRWICCADWNRTRSTTSGYHCRTDVGIQRVVDRPGQRVGCGRCCLITRCEWRYSAQRLHFRPTSYHHHPNSPGKHSGTINSRDSVANGIFSNSSTDS